MDGLLSSWQCNQSTVVVKLAVQHEYWKDNDEHIEEKQTQLAFRGKQEGSPSTHQGLLATHSGLCTASTDMLVIKRFGEYLIDYFCPCDTHEYHGILNHERVCFKNAYSSSSASRAAMHANVELVKYKKKEGPYFLQAESKTFWWWSCSKILPKY